MSLVIVNTMLGNQVYVINCKRCRKYDSSNKPNYFDVDGFSQHIRTNSLRGGNERILCAQSSDTQQPASH